MANLDRLALTQTFADTVALWSSTPASGPLYRSGIKFGVDDVWILVPVVYADPHLRTR